MTDTSQQTSSSTPFIWPTQYIGDDWAFPYTYTNSDGTPIDLTGASPQASLFGKNQVAPVFQMSGMTGVTIVNAAAGTVIFNVARALTSALAADGWSDGYPTRIQVQLLDSLGVLKTFRVDGVPVADARFVPIVAPST